MASIDVLVNVVLQAMPIYLFSTLVAPKLFLKHIREIQREFLWGGNHGNHGWALVSWDTVCKPKDQGGLGLRDLKKNNQVLGAKIWWH